MPDNVNVTAGSGTIIGTRARTVNAIANTEIQTVEELGSALIYTVQVNVSTAAVTLIAARSDRLRVTITNRQAEPIFIGPATVTAANGFQIDAGDSKIIGTTALIQAISATVSGASEKVHVLEEADL